MLSLKIQVENIQYEWVRKHFRFRIRSLNQNLKGRLSTLDPLILARKSNSDGFRSTECSSWSFCSWDNVEETIVALFVEVGACVVVEVGAGVVVEVGAWVVGWVDVVEDKEVDEMIGRAGAELTPEKYNICLDQ